MRRPALLLAALLAVSGCFSSSHVGRDPRKIYMTVKDGSRGYMKNGEFFPERGFGGSLVEVTADNPDALAAAQKFRGRAVGGFIMVLAGTLCMPMVTISGFARALEDTESSGFPESHGYMLLGCAAITTVGAVYLLSGMPSQLDAVNIYNDALDERTQLQWPPPPAPQLPSLPPGPPGGP
jgi:hypothetical protein